MFLYPTNGYRRVQSTRISQYHCCHVFTPNVGKQDDRKGRPICLNLSEMIGMSRRGGGGVDVGGGPCGRPPYWWVALMATPPTGGHKGPPPHPRYPRPYAKPRMFFPIGMNSIPE